MRKVIHFDKSRNAEWIDFQGAAAFLGYRGQEPDAQTMEDMKRCAEKLVEVMEPAYLWESAKVQYADGTIQTSRVVLTRENEICEIPLVGESILKHLKHSEDTVCACLTLGTEPDLLIESLQKKSMLEALLTDALASAAAEKVRAALVQEVKNSFEKKAGWLFAIGYGDFPLSTQKVFLHEMNATEEIGITCNEKFLLNPMKSVTGFIDFSD